MNSFRPLIPSGHAQTVVCAFWPRRINPTRFPTEENLIETSPGNRILLKTQRPEKVAIGHLLMVHGLCGDSESGYLRGLSQAALERGFVTHRMNLRGAHRTEHLCQTLYHAGLTDDLHHLLPRFGDLPLLVAGYSLGGNMALKLAGELGSRARGSLAGVIAVSAPVDLAECVRALGRIDNWIYQDYFVARLKKAIRAHHRHVPSRYAVDRMRRVRTVFEFDDTYVAPPFGFGRAEVYYRTQSARQFTSEITIPALMLQAQDDPLIPFRVYEDPVIVSNHAIERISPRFGGHNAFLSLHRPRNWGDGIVLNWAERIARTN